MKINDRKLRENYECQNGVGCGAWLLLGGRCRGESAAPVLHIFLCSGLLFLILILSRIERPEKSTESGVVTRTPLNTLRT